MKARSVIVAALSCLVLIAVVGGLWFATQRERATGASSKLRDGATATRWICAMHPSIVSDRPGTCPICGMNLVPADEVRANAKTGGIPGLATVTLGDEKRRRIGAATVPVTRAPFRREIRAVARIEVDETRLHRVHTKTSGFVERLYANAVGETVRKGQPLFDLYSPELLAAQREFLVALRAEARLQASEIPEVATSAQSLVASARRRLSLLDMAQGEIDTLAKTGEVQRTVSIRAPASGTILSRQIAQGSEVEPGAALMALGDLSRVWAIASVFESDLAVVHQGDDARLVLGYLAGREIRGKVALIYPVLDPDTRTAQVRIEIANPAGELKPGMFGEVVLAAELGERLSVPAEAVMETGTRAVAFVDTGDGAFVPREVTVGLRLRDRIEILSGLTEGERVLASGNFFVDAESRLRAALEATSPPAAHPAEPRDTPPREPPGAQPPPHRH